MKYLFIILCTFSFSLMAEVQPFFISQGKHGLIMIQGQDNDALNLYKALDVPGVDNRGYYVKKAGYISYPSFNPDFNIECRKSVRVETLASCKITIRSEMAHQQIPPVIDPQKRQMRVLVLDPVQGEEVLGLFFERSESNTIFESQDGSLKITYDRNLDTGGFNSFRLEYLDQ